jgi:hypothetical protein
MTRGYYIPVAIMLPRRLSYFAMVSLVNSEIRGPRHADSDRVIWFLDSYTDTTLSLAETALLGISVGSSEG